MQIIFEDPLPMLLVGLVLLTFTAVLYYSTRGTGAFVAMVVIGVLTLSTLVLEQVVETPKERIESTLRGFTNAIEANDLERVLSFLHDDAFEIRKLAEDLMPQLDITAANIMNEMEVETNDPKDPTEAIVKFRGFFRATHKRHGIEGGETFPIEVHLKREGVSWLVTGYDSTDQNLRTEADRLRR